MSEPVSGSRKIVSFLHSSISVLHLSSIGLSDKFGIRYTPFDGNFHPKNDDTHR